VWLRAEGTITTVDQRRHDYSYSFRSEDGRTHTGTIQLDGPGGFSVGQKVPVAYVRGDPDQNRHADASRTPLVDWVVLALGVLALSRFVRPVRSAWSGSRRLSRLAGDGRPVPGTLVEARRNPANGMMEVTFQYRMPEDGPSVPVRQYISPVPLKHFAGGEPPPQQGATVAVWPAGQTLVLL
jgi:hypothetical protein